MKSIEVSPEDFEFLSIQAKDSEMSLTEFVSYMVDRQRVIAKQSASPVLDTRPGANLEAPHRKWGM